MSRVTPDLPERLLAQLRAGMPALLLSLGPDDYPGAAYTWAAALDSRRVRFAADLGSSTFANLERTARASLQIIGTGGLLFLVKGRTRLVREQIQAAAFSVAMLEMEVVEVKNQAWQDVTVAPLVYAWPAHLQASMTAMEQAVYAELREWEAGP